MFVGPVFRDGIIGFLILSLILYLCTFSRFSQMNYSFRCCCGFKRKQLKKTRAWDRTHGKGSGGQAAGSAEDSVSRQRTPGQGTLQFAAAVPGVVAGSGLPRWVTSGEPSRLDHPSPQTQRESLPPASHPHAPLHAPSPVSLQGKPRSELSRPPAGTPVEYRFRETYTWEH